MKEFMKFVAITSIVILIFQLVRLFS